MKSCFANKVAAQVAVVLAWFCVMAGVSVAVLFGVVTMFAPDYAGGRLNVLECIGLVALYIGAGQVGHAVARLLVGPLVRKVCPGSGNGMGAAATGVAGR